MIKHTQRGYLKMAKKHINKFGTLNKDKAENLKKKEPAKFIGAVKPTGKLRVSRKQSWSRADNVTKKANSDTELGKKVRAMLFDMTKDKKYKERNYQKSKLKYDKVEVRTSLTQAKKLAEVNAKKQYKRLVKIQKERNKIPSYQSFRKDKNYTRSKADTIKAKKEYKKLVATQKKKKIKITSYKDFKKANPHLVNPLTGFDSADIEAFYDS